jgi:cytoskeletal protein RodZ
MTGLLCGGMPFYWGMATIGQQLKIARNERGLTIEDVAFQTRIPAGRVRDLEGDDLSKFANLTYARGFLKLYGEFLELDLSDYLSQFRTEEFAHASGHEYVQTAQATGNLPAAVFLDHGRARRPGLYLLAAAALAAGAVVWWNKGDDAKEAEKAEAAKPAPAEPDKPAAVAKPVTPPVAAAPLPEPVPAVEPVTVDEPATAPPVEPAPKPGPAPKAKVVVEEEEGPQ